MRSKIIVGIVLTLYVVGLSLCLSACWDAEYIKYTGDQSYVVIETEQFNRLITAVEKIVENTNPQPK